MYIYKQETDKNASLFYSQGIFYFTQNKIEEALSEFNKALNKDSQNNEYILMKKIAEYKLSQNEDISIKYYADGLKKLMNDNYKEAKKLFNLAMETRKNDINKNLIEEGLNFIEEKKADITKCSPGILFVLFGDGNEKVSFIIEEREKGKIWYDIESLADDLQLQPHEIIALQDTIIFPPKSKNKKSRRIEF